MPAGSMPTIGLQLLAQQKGQGIIDAWTKRIDALTAANDRLEKRVTSMSSKIDKHTKSAASSMAKNLRTMRWEMVTLMFFFRRLEGVVKAAFGAMVEAEEAATARRGTRALGGMYGIDVGALTAQLRAISEGTLNVQQSLQLAQKAMLKDQGEFVDQYVELWDNARLGAAVSGAEAVKVFEAMVSSMAEGSGQILDSAVPIYQAELAIKRYADSMGIAVEEVDRLTAATIIWNSIQSTTRDLEESGARSALNQAGSLEELKSSWQELLTVYGTAGRAGGGFQVITNLLRTVTRLVVVYGAAWSATSRAAGTEYHQEFLEGLPPILKQVSQGLWEVIRPLRVIFWEIPRAAGGKPSEEYTKYFEEIGEAMGLFQDEVDKTMERDFTKVAELTLPKIDPIIDQILRRGKLISKHNRRLEEIQRSHDRRIDQIRVNLERQRLRISRSAQRDRDRILRQYNRRKEKDSEDFNLRERHYYEDHLLKLKHLTQKYLMDRMHDETMYQYERGMLVAEGDVLAIEDLDARYAMEQNKEKDNFRLRQKQAGETYENEKRQRRERFKEDLDDIRQAYQDRLDEIDAIEAERLQEAEDRAIEERNRAAEDLAYRLEQQKEAHRQELTEWGEFWDKVAQQTKLKNEIIKTIILEYYGPGGEVEQILTDFQRRTQFRADITRRVTAITSEATGPKGTFDPGYEPTDWIWSWLHDHQYGGSGTANRPTMIPVGVHGPEQYSVQPLSTIGGTLNVKWQGGSIPIRGEGGLQGADLSAVGDAIATGLVSSLNSIFTPGGL